MAATVAAQAGAHVVLFEAGGWLGGRLGLQTQLLQGPKSIFHDATGVDFCGRMVEDAQRSGVDIRPNTPVHSLCKQADGFAVGFHGGDGPSTIRARGLILATGSVEPPGDFSGSSLQGVMLSGDAQERLVLHGEKPGKRAIMVGSDNAGLLIAQALRKAGTDVVAVIERARRVVGREFNAAPLRDAGVEILTSTGIAEAGGQDRVASVTIAKLSDEGRAVVNGQRRFELDTICLALPRTPRTALAEELGCPAMDIPALGGVTPLHTAKMATPVPGLYIAGDVAGVENGAAALESGRLAGLGLSEELGYRHPETATQLNLARGRLGYLRRGGRGLLKRKAKSAIASECRRMATSR
ncbi:MAG: FAD-dependent oxidoreductase [Chloroflexi bacterium]|nr:FAD-dependent oxidoreductase [Chloroflexota bacterium]